MAASIGHRYAEAWCSQDPDSVAAFFADNGSLSVNDGEPAVGRQAIAEVAQGFMTDFPDMVVTMNNLELKPEGAIFHWTLTGTNTGPGGTGRVGVGVKATYPPSPLPTGRGSVFAKH